MVTLAGGRARNVPGSGDTGLKRQGDLTLRFSTLLYYSFSNSHVKMLYRRSQPMTRRSALLPLNLSQVKELLSVIRLLASFLMTCYKD
jgi:hypothetical protein